MEYLLIIALILSIVSIVIIIASPSIDSREDIKMLKTRIRILEDDKTIEKNDPIAEKYCKLMKYKSFEPRIYRHDYVGVKYHFTTGKTVSEQRTFGKVPEIVILTIEELNNKYKETLDLKERLCENKCKKTKKGANNES